MWRNTIVSGRNELLNGQTCWVEESTCGGDPTRLKKDTCLISSTLPGLHPTAPLRPKRSVKSLNKFTDHPHS